MLTAERLREVLSYDPETGVFVWKTKTSNRIPAGTESGHLNAGHKYVTIRVDRKSYLRARLAWLYVHGKWPDPQVDHIDRDRSNDRICNLREATQPQNIANSRKSKSIYRGIEPNRGKWQARIKIDGKRLSLGTFVSPEDAARTYDEAAKKYYGQFATLNFP